MINQDPNELSTILLKIISSTENYSLINLLLILLGRFFQFCKAENLTKRNYDYLSLCIYKSASYYKESWPQLPELLFELINTNSIRLFIRLYF